MAVQLDRKGADDLIDHFRKNGLSEKAINKIKQDILNGDMQVDLLRECNYDEIAEMCKDYSFNVLQKKAFIKAVKLLQNSKANERNSNNNNTNNKIVQRIYIAPQEQSLFNDIKLLSNNLSNYKNKCQEVDLKNKSTISITCDKLIKYGNKIKLSVDTTINKLIEKV